MFIEMHCVFAVQVKFPRIITEIAWEKKALIKKCNHNFFRGHLFSVKMSGKFFGTTVVLEVG